MPLSRHKGDCWLDDTPLKWLPTGRGRNCCARCQLGYNRKGGGGGRGGIWEFLDLIVVEFTKLLIQIKWETSSNSKSKSSGRLHQTLDPNQVVGRVHQTLDPNQVGEDTKVGEFTKLLIKIKWDWEVTKLSIQIKWASHQTLDPNQVGEVYQTLDPNQVERDFTKLSIQIKQESLPNSWSKWSGRETSPNSRSKSKWESLPKSFSQIKWESSPKLLIQMK